MRLSAVAVGVLLALVVAILLAVSFTAGGPTPGNSGPAGTVGTTGTTPGNSAAGNP